MNESFDPYREWLGIEPHERPIDCYRLLGLERFEAEAARIAAAAEGRMLHVRQFQTGPRGVHTQRLLNELAAAKVCLLDPATKATYDVALDASLRAADAPPAPPPGGWPAGPPSGETAPGDPPPAGGGVEPGALFVVPPPRMPAAGAAGAGAPEVSATGWRRRGWMILATAAALLLLGMLAVGGWTLAARWPPPVADAEDAPVEPEPAEEPPEDPGPVVVEQEATGEVNLSASLAGIEGAVVLDAAAGSLAGWSDPGDAARWRFRLLQPAVMRVEVTYTAPREEGRYRIAIDDRTHSLRVRSRGDEAVTDEMFLAVPRSGQRTLEMTFPEPPDGSFRLHRLRLAPR